MDFVALVDNIRAIHERARGDAARAVNVGLTLRNWAIGMHISEYELRGEDRAHYGEHLVDRLADSLRQAGVPSSDRRRLYRYRELYRTYPQIRGALTPQFRVLLPDSTPTADNIVRSPTPQFEMPPGKLLNSLSYTHLEQFVAIADPLKRTFYEVECIRGQWSVRELKRQIASLYFERSALSKDKDALARHVQSLAEPDTPALVVRDPYVFEFLGLRPQETMLESDLEAALLDRLQQFLLELGRGFCFEARQKRIRIGDEHFFVDLVFYHRLLRCHVLVELKVDAFNHEHLGQLNTYVNWYRENETTAGDLAPIGILLCTDKNDALVEYALAGIDNQLFVSRYQVALPDKRQIEAFIKAQLEGGME